MASGTRSIILHGSSGIMVDIQCHVSNNLPNIIIVGYVSKAVNEARERLRGAFASAKLRLPRKRITINLAPADIPKSDSGLDLAIAVAIMQAGDMLPATLSSHEVFIGELGLDGKTRAVRGIIGKLLAGRSRGITTFYIPADNLAQAQLIPGISVVAVANLGELYQHFAGLGQLTPLATKRGNFAAPDTAHSGLPLSEIAGQTLAKRALEIAAAGGHNLFMNGPPGSGKTMLAGALIGLLPAMGREEALEVTHLHSLANDDYGTVAQTRPLRAPHHSASLSALIGGGQPLRPGEASLAHRGVLFLDELPEFKRQTIESLRQPLEDSSIRLPRPSGTVCYPADFILVATGNPCPCGYHGSTKACSCSPYDISSYRRSLSGPLLDRIDLYCHVQPVDHTKLLKHHGDSSEDSLARSRVLGARALQAKRYGPGGKLNARMNNRDIRRLARLEPAAASLLNTAAANMQLSGRAYMRTIKVARTIADLEQSPIITADCLTEALSYRFKGYETS